MTGWQQVLRVTTLVLSTALGSIALAQSVAQPVPSGHTLTGELTKAELKQKLEVYAKADAKLRETETIVRATEALAVPAAPVTYVTGGCANGNCPKAGATTSYYQPAASNCPNGNCPKAATTTSNYQPAAANGNCPKRR